jgi:hypothetical protein
MLRTKYLDGYEFDFTEGWVNPSKKVGAVEYCYRRFKIFKKREHGIKFVLSKGTRAYRLSGSTRPMLCVDVNEQTTFNLSGEAVSIPKETLEKIDIMFDEEIMEQMIPSHMSIVRLLLICGVSAVIGGVIVYNYMSQPDPTLWKEFLEWKKTMGYLICLLR